MRRSLAVLAVMVLASLTTVAARPAAAQVTCPAGRTLTIVAHEDDDLLFLSPDLLHDVQGGRCVRTVFLTAGDAGLDSSYWLGREEGARDAYDSMVGASGAWVQTDAGISGHPIPVFTHPTNARVSLAFMRLPDGFNGTGTGTYGNQSMEQLWQSTIPVIEAVDDSSSYTRSSLISTLTSLMVSYQPDRVRTQDYGGEFGDGDHSDHHAAGRFVQEANDAYTSTPHTFTGYQGYRTRFYPANVNGADLTGKSNAFYAYGQNDIFACGSASACAGSLYERWLPRQYPVSTNLARGATATASTQDTSTEQTADKAIDGVLAGFGDGDHRREWATTGQGAGSWLQLTWSSPQTISRIVLYDRPNVNDQITNGRLEFSDGSTVQLCPEDCPLPNDGIAQIVEFSARTVTSVRLDVTGVSGSTVNAGLMEMEAYELTGP